MSIITIATELIEYGVIQLSAQNLGTSAEFHIFCTGLQINNDHLSILFQKDGRYTYFKQLHQMGGEIDTTNHQGKGSTIIIRLQT